MSLSASLFLDRRLSNLAQESLHDVVGRVESGFPQSLDHRSSAIDQSCGFRPADDAQGADDRDTHGLRTAPGLQVVDDDAVCAMQDGMTDHLGFARAEVPAQDVGWCDLVVHKDERLEGR